MAEVFLAELNGPMGFARRLAVKRILPHLVHDTIFVQSFIDEAKVGAQLTHPHIVKTEDLTLVDGQPCLAMEYVEGGHFGYLIQRARELRTPLPLPFVQELVAQVARGLDFAHNATNNRGRPLHLIHRDIKPSNLLLGFDGQAKLVDFGIARASSNLTQTQPSTVKGSLPYMSPEQACGESRLTPASDLFSLGTVLFELLTLERLYQGQSQGAVLMQVSRGPSQARLEVLKAQPEEAQPLVHLCLKLLSPRVEDRFPTAAALLYELEQLKTRHLSLPQMSRLAREWLVRVQLPVLPTGWHTSTDSGGHSPAVPEVPASLEAPPAIEPPPRNATSEEAKSVASDGASDFGAGEHDHWPTLPSMPSAVLNALFAEAPNGSESHDAAARVEKTAGLPIPRPSTEDDELNEGDVDTGVLEIGSQVLLSPDEPSDLAQVPSDTLALAQKDSTFAPSPVPSVGLVSPRRDQPSSGPFGARHEGEVAASPTLATASDAVGEAMGYASPNTAPQTSVSQVAALPRPSIPAPDYPRPDHAQPVDETFPGSRIAGKRLSASALEPSPVHESGRPPLPHGPALAVAPASEASVSEPSFVARHTRELKWLAGLWLVGVVGVLGFKLLLSPGAQATKPSSEFQELTTAGTTQNSGPWTGHWLYVLGDAGWQVSRNGTPLGPPPFRFRLTAPLASLKLVANKNGLEVPINAAVSADSAWVVRLREGVAPLVLALGQDPLEEASMPSDAGSHVPSSPSDAPPGNPTAPDTEGRRSP